MNDVVDDKLEYTKTHRHQVPMGALAVDVHPDGDRAFVACMDGVYQLDVESGRHQRLYSHSSYTSGVVCIHEHDLLISAGYDGNLQWYDLRANSVVRQSRSHSFWSWDLARGRQAPVVASVTGQYLAGGYRYEPRRADEPTVRVYDAVNGTLLSSFQHVPPVQSVAVSDDGEFVAAGNLMGDVGVWRVGGEQVARWNTPDFTGFGVIKSHCQIGGIHAAAFALDQPQLIAAGMGPMRDPMAGNGKQRWQRFDWSTDPVTKVAESVDDQTGEGLMETLAVHPSGRHFVMAGRLRGGNWNVGLFDSAGGELVHSLKTGVRVTQAVFSSDGKRLFLAGADKQTSDADKPFGVVDVFDVQERSDRA